MICKKCGNKIPIIRYIIEGINIFIIGKHICPNCGYDNNIKFNLFICYVFSVGVGKIVRYTIEMSGMSYDSLALLKILLIRVLFIYICYVIKQFTFWIKN